MVWKDDGRENATLYEGQWQTLSDRGHPVLYKQNPRSSAHFVFEETEEPSNLPQTHSKYEMKKDIALYTGYCDEAFLPRQLFWAYGSRGIRVCHGWKGSRIVGEELVKRLHH